MCYLAFGWESGTCFDDIKQFVIKTSHYIMDYTMSSSHMVFIYSMYAFSIHQIV